MPLPLKLVLLEISLLLCALSQSGFANEKAQKLDPSVRDGVLRRARFIQHSTKERPQFDAKRLASMGAVPVELLRVDNATYYLSQPFALDSSHQIAVALVEVGDTVTARVLYRSNSQFSWRLCDAVKGGHIGKGFHEYDKQMPISVTVALLRRADRVGRLRAVEGIAKADDSQHELAEKLLKGLTADFQSGLKSGQVVIVDKKYMTKEYANVMPADPIPFSLATGELRTVVGGSVADPNKTKLPPIQKLPDLEHLIDSVQYKNPAFARFSRTEGVLTGKVFLSRDRTMRYLFFEDSVGRAVLSGVELLEAPINKLGLRSQYVDVRGMDAPLMEYGDQIPEQYGGRRRYRYQMNWSFVREQPIIKLYYDRLGRQLPPATVANNGE